MEDFLFAIDDFIDNATDYLIDYAYYNTDESFFTALSFFYTAIFIGIVFAILSKTKKISMKKGVFYPYLIFSATLALTAGILCIFWVAIIISIIGAIVIPITEKREYERYTGKKSELTVKKYVVYFVLSAIGLVIGHFIRLNTV